ncbi:MAG TPA: ATP-binding protein [Burkholderiaceae bacterium]|nr:ATP-binding protein [Burkholderiaceae bacterium]
MTSNAKEESSGTPAPRLFIVDDEPALMQALCSTLGVEGYETVGFTSAQAALEALPQGRCNLLLADLMMPEMSGIELLRAALRTQPDLVGIIMTGEGTVASAVEAMKVGALDYILKPFKLSAVLPVLARALAMQRLRLQNAALEQRLRERAAELEALNKELDAFSYSVSHDLQVPLRAIQGFSRILQEGYGQQLDEEANRLLNIITESVSRMTQLIRDLLDFSHLGRRPLGVSEVDMQVLVNQVLQDLRNVDPGHAFECKVDALPHARGDRTLVRQVWTNLLSNAVKYSSKTEQPSIQVSCTSVDGVDVYTVKDNGAGFSMQYYDKMFGMFRRLHRTDEFPGTGVGLAIVHRIVTRHGGKVWAEAEVDKGAAFHFTLGVVDPGSSPG